MRIELHDPVAPTSNQSIQSSKIRFIAAFVHDSKSQAMQGPAKPASAVGNLVNLECGSPIYPSFPPFDAQGMISVEREPGVCPLNCIANGCLSEQVGQYIFDCLIHHSCSSQHYLGHRC